ncbi:MAG: rane dipeptidase, partial [Actinomycetota bacterium]|nr:rane dipeptidase [Actinomycetota bacterium]
MTSGELARATAMLDSMILADGHNDLPWALRDRSGPNPVAAVAGTDLTVSQPDLHT